jgi:hypothetical protein
VIRFPPIIAQNANYRSGLPIWTADLHAPAGVLAALPL